MPLRRLWRLLRLGASADNGYVGSKRRDIGSCSATAGVDNARTRRLRGPGAKPSSPGQQQGQGAVRRQTFSAFLAERQFSRDVAYALWLPLVLAAFAARSCDAPGAAIGTCEAGKERGLALSSFPCGAAPMKQVLHVLRHLPWYLLVRPARVGDWAGLLSNAHHLAFTGLVLVLAAAPRQGALWDWWRRHRVLAAWSTARGGSTLLQLVTYPLLPRARWPDAVFGPYTLLVSTHPLASTLVYCALDLFVGFPFLAASKGILLHTVAALVAAYAVAPHIVDLEHGTPDGSTDNSNTSRTSSSSSSSSGSSGAEGTGRTKCDAPSHRQLLCCRPVWQQALLAAAMVALPLTLAALSQRWLWGCYVTALRRRQQQEQELEQQGKQDEQQQQTQQQQEREQPPVREEKEGSTLLEKQLMRPQALRGKAHNPGPMLSLHAPLRSPSQAAAGSAGARRAMYQGMGTWQSLSVKVLEHPGSFEEFAPRLVAAVEQVVRGTEPAQPHKLQPSRWQGHAMIAAPATAAPAAADASPGGLLPTMSPALHSCVVLRGCTHVWMWSGGILVPSHAASSPDAGGTTAQQQQQQQQEDTPLLAGEAAARLLVSRVVGALPDPDQLAGVWVQVADAHGCRVVNAAQLDGGMRVPREVVRLLRMWPPALVLPTRGLEGQGEGQGDGQGHGEVVGRAEGGATQAQQKHGRLSLVLESPAPQDARLVVVRQERGAEGSDGLLRKGVVVAEFPLQLAAGVQEEEVDLGVVLREVVGRSGEGAGPDSSEAEVLHVLLLPPLGHGGGGSDSGAPLPLVHFSAPLLLLPTDAAVELRQYEADVLQTAAEEGAAAEEGEHAGGGAAAAPAGAAAAAAPSEGVAAEGVAAEGVAAEGVDVGACQRWGRAMVPLLRDLAMVVVANSYARTSTGSREGLGAGAGTEVVGGGGTQGGGDPGNGQEGVGWGASGHEAVRAAIMPGLLVFLRDNAMDSLAALLEAAPWDGSTEAAGAAAGVTDVTTDTSGRSPLASDVMVLTEPAPGEAVVERPRAESAPAGRALAPPTPSTTSGAQADSSGIIRGRRSLSSQSAISSQAAGGGGGGGQPTAPSLPAPSPSRTAGTATAPAACGPPQPTMPNPADYPTAADILLGFRPSAQERCFQDWRAAGLLRAAVPLMLLAAVPHAYAVVCTIASLMRSPQAPRVGATGAGVSWAWDVAAVVAFFAASLVADGAGYLAVLLALHVARWRRRARHPQEEEEEQQQQQLPAVSIGTSSKLDSHGRGPAAKAAGSGPQQMSWEPVGRMPVVSVALGRPYLLGTLVVAPALQLLITSLARLMPHSSELLNAGGPSAVLVVAATRAVTGPCVQQLAARQVALASPVLMVSDSMLLGLLRPERGAAKRIGMAGCWRLSAVLLSVGFDWWARGRFLRGLRVQMRERGADGGGGTGLAARLGVGVGEVREGAQGVSRGKSKVA